MSGGATDTFLAGISSNFERSFAEALLASVMVTSAQRRRVTFIESGSFLIVESQVRFVDFGDETRADFVFSLDHGPGAERRVLIVEIDDASHWHSGKKAAADRARDRWNLFARNLPTMRFSNQEVALSRDGIADMVVKHLLEVSTESDVRMNAISRAHAEGRAYATETGT
jgi:hypothetical protein